VLKAWPHARSQKVAVSLYLALLRKAHCRAELSSTAEYGGATGEGATSRLYRTFMRCGVQCSERLSALLLLPCAPLPQTTSAS